MNRSTILLLLNFATCFFSVSAQETEELIQSGNEFYKQKQYEQAIAKYNEALKTDPSNATIKYNLALALYRSDKKKESVKLFNELTVPDQKNENFRSNSYYNGGAVLSSEKKLEESIEAYKNALRINPSDKEARENLQKALLELKKRSEKPPQPKKQEQQSQSKLNNKQTEQKLNQLEQKEKQVQQRVQQQRSGSGSSQPKDW